MSWSSDMVKLIRNSGQFDTFLKLKPWFELLGVHANDGKIAGLLVKNMSNLLCYILS